uniref:Uncharacterized protein n=1 Tax=Setaria italica TaxID=4555 RepID=K3ZPU2_SETIT
MHSHVIVQISRGSSDPLLLRPLTLRSASHYIDLARISVDDVEAAWTNLQETASGWPKRKSS